MSKIYNGDKVIGITNNRGKEIFTMEEAYEYLRQVLYYEPFDIYFEDGSIEIRSVDTHKSEYLYTLEEVYLSDYFR